MVVKSNGKIVYGTWKNGSDIYKDQKGYYIVQWNPKTSMEYKKYMRTSWKPNNIQKAKNKKRSYTNSDFISYNKKGDFYGFW